MRKLQIVWRNPNPVKRQHRWYAKPMPYTLGLASYVIEELVGDGIFIYWRVRTTLEVLRYRAA